MAYRPNPDNQGWVTCRDRLLEAIAKPPLSAAEALEFIQSFVVRYSLKDRIA